MLEHKEYQSQEIEPFRCLNQVFRFVKRTRTADDVIQSNLRNAKLLISHTVDSTWRSGHCYLNKGECNLNQSKDDTFVERVAKNNS